MAPRICIAGRFLTQPTTGVQRYGRELLRAWRGWEGDCEVLAPRDARSELEGQALAARRVGVLRGHAWEQLDLPRFVRHRVLFCPGNVAPLATLASRTRVVVTLHDLSYRLFPSAYGRAFRAAYRVLVPAAIRGAAHILTVSETAKREILAAHPAAAGKITAITNGALPGALLERAERERFAPPIDAPYLLYVGSTSRRKNLRGFLEAFALLARDTDLHAVVVGSSAPIFRAAAIAVPEWLRDRVHLLGQVEAPATLLGCYQNAACLVFPSFYESSGLPPLEAMACGCPVLASAIPALEERCGDAAAYCDPYDAADIAAQTRTLLDDPDRRRLLVERGRARARRFTWERCAAETRAVLESVLADSC